MEHLGQDIHPRCYERNEALRGIEWVELAFPEVNVLVLVNVNVPKEVRSYALKAKFRKHGTNPCKQKLSGAIFVWLDGYARGKR